MTEFLRLESRDDLDRLVQDAVEESLTLEYKASEALARESKKIDELCKDVSAMANAAGGQIIYGIPEIKHKPQAIDAGTKSSILDREWIEQILLSRVQPRMNFIIKPIELNNSSFAYVITIPQSSVGHQAPDRKYYKRYNFSSVPMADYEIRDVMGRTTKPELAVDARFQDGKNEGAASYIRPRYRDEGDSDPITLEILVRNLSRSPAEYAELIVYLDRVINVVGLEGFVSQRGEEEFYKRRCMVLKRELGLPSQAPVFKESQVLAGSITATIPSKFMDRMDPVLLMFAYDVRAPGFQSRRRWPLDIRSGWISRLPDLEWPED
ncbi:MAG: ATP-binding protein [Bauldia sp.]|nr:ATP-binding protein [Bauldia sp.]